MGHAVFKKWTNAVRHLDKKLKNNRLIAGHNIQLEKTGYGIRINSRSVSENSDTYKGYFKVIQTAPNKIKIVDGMDEEATNCGNISVNKLALAPVTATELTITANAYIYLKCKAVYTNGTLTSSINTIVQYATEQLWDIEEEKKLISRVLFANEAITNFSNEPVDCRVNIRGTC